MLKVIDISQIGKVIEERSLNGSLVIPSVTHGYSLCIEYAKQWLFKKISKNFFNGVYVDGRYILDEFQKLKGIEDQIAKNNPVLAITPNIDVAYNRDFVDFTPNMVGIDNYIQRSRLETPFFEDHNRHLRIATTSKAIQVAFTYKIRLSTKAEQLDLREFMAIAYKQGATWGEYIDQDYIVPYKMMLNLAKDAGFEVKDNCVINILGFVNYLNQHSKLPFTYKFRGASGHSEFFIRIKDQYVHTRTNEIDKDDGEKKNHLETNFMVEMSTLVTYPVPQYYMYYSEISHFGIRDINGPIYDEQLGIYELNLIRMPDLDENNWSIYMTTDVLEKDLSKPLYMDNLFELFRSSDTEESDIQKIINWNNKMGINSNIFLHIKLFNNGKEVQCKVNWTDGVLTTDNTVEHEASALAIYVNRQYLNEQLIEQEQYKKTRVK